VRLWRNHHYCLRQKATGVSTPTSPTALATHQVTRRSIDFAHCAKRKECRYRCCGIAAMQGCALRRSRQRRGGSDVTITRPVAVCSACLLRLSCCWLWWRLRRMYRKFSRKISPDWLSPDRISATISLRLLAAAAVWWKPETDCSNASIARRGGDVGWWCAWLWIAVSFKECSWLESAKSNGAWKTCPLFKYKQVSLWQNV